MIKTRGVDDCFNNNKIIFILIEIISTRDMCVSTEFQNKRIFHTDMEYSYIAVRSTDVYVEND